jgi:hypothetical protein
MRCPAEFYTASPRPYDGLPELQYPWHDRDILVTACGRICMHRKTVLAGQKLGIKEVDDKTNYRSTIYLSAPERIRTSDPDHCSI